MKIYEYDVPNEMILEYCRLITLYENSVGYSADVDRMRREIHTKIFDYVGCHSSLYREKDRRFNTALNKVVLDLTLGVN